MGLQRIGPVLNRLDLCQGPKFCGQGQAGHGAPAPMAHPWMPYHYKINSNNLNKYKGQRVFLGSILMGLAQAILKGAGHA